MVNFLKAKPKSQKQKLNEVALMVYVSFLTKQPPEKMRDVQLEVLKEKHNPQNSRGDHLHQVTATAGVDV